MRLLHLARRALGVLVLGAVFATSALLLASPLLGLERYVITGKSMTGSIPRGAVVLEKAVPVADLRVGDVVTYLPPANANHPELVTHRITKVVRAEDGQRAFRTKGDANRSTDPWTFTLQRATQPRVVFHVPVVGYGIAALGDREIRMAAIGAPALLIAIATLAGLARDVRRERRRAAPGVVMGAPPA